MGNPPKIATREDSRHCITSTVINTAQDTPCGEVKLGCKAFTLPQLTDLKIPLTFISSSLLHLVTP